MRPVAGGTDSLVEAKDGKRDRGALFDLTVVPELSGIEEETNHIRIGATATHAEMMASPLLKRYVPALPIGCSWVGGPQIRNRGTLGGNLAHGSPAGDTIPALYVADAVVQLVSVSDRREIPIAEFFTGPGKTVLAADELILGVKVPKRPGVRASFLRLGQRQAQAISKVSVAVAMSFKEGRPDWVRVALGAVAPTVIRAPRTEAALLAGRLRRDEEGARRRARGGPAHRRHALHARVSAGHDRDPAAARHPDHHRRLTRTLRRGRDGRSGSPGHG